MKLTVIKTTSQPNQYDNQKEVALLDDTTTTVLKEVVPRDNV